MVSGLSRNFLVDDQGENTLRAARRRILGTISGGLVVFLVHTLLSGWIWILVSLLITIPLLRRLGGTSDLSTAVVITVIFLGTHDYALLNWSYVLNRSIDTLVGICVALVMGHLLWPKDRLKRMEEIHQKLMTALNRRMQHHTQALQGITTPPPPLNPGSITRGIFINSASDQYRTTTRSTASPPAHSAALETMHQPLAQPSIALDFKREAS